MQAKRDNSLHNFYKTIFKLISMRPLEIMTKAMNMLDIPKNKRTGNRDLNYILPKLVENLLLESLGEPLEYNWVEESVRKLRPDCYEGGLFNRQTVAPIYENLAQVYDFIKANGIIETENMIRFRKYLWIYQKTTEHLDTRGICKDETPEKNPIKSL